MQQPKPQHQKWLIGPAALLLSMGVVSAALAHGDHAESKPPVAKNSSKNRVQQKAAPARNEQAQANTNQRTEAPNTLPQTLPTEDAVMRRMLTQLEVAAGRPLTEVEKQNARRAVEARNAAIRAAQEQLRRNLALILNVPPTRLPSSVGDSPLSQGEEDRRHPDELGASRESNADGEEAPLPSDNAIYPTDDIRHRSDSGMEHEDGNEDDNGAVGGDDDTDAAGQIDNAEHYEDGAHIDPRDRY